MLRLRQSLGLGLVAWLVIAGLALVAWLAMLNLALAQPAAEAAPHQVLVMLRLQPEHARPNADSGGSYGGGVEQAERRRTAERLARRYGLAMVDNWPMPLVGVDCFVLAVPEGQSPAEVAGKLSHEPDVAWSEPMNLYRAQSSETTHNDPLYRAQPAAKEWRLAALHRYATGRNVRVAVIDSMVQADHPDLVGQVAVARNFVAGRSDAPERHGTAVAGLIAARADNGVGIAGVAPGARLMALRACWQRSPEDASAVCDSLGLAKALDFAISHDAQVINLSLSGPSDTLLARLLDAAEQRHITVVGAYDRAAPGGGFPASHSGVLAVADEAWGPAPAGVYAAAGSDTPATTPGGRWSLVSGSSFAAAEVSGLVALAREHEAGAASIKLVSASGGAIDACATVSAGANCECCARVVESAAIRQR
jgi:subtilisin family serine protease